MSGVENIYPHLELYRYWDAKRGDRPEPIRRDIDPPEIPRLLRHIALVQPMADGYRWRLMGTAIAADIGSDLTARKFGGSVGPLGFVRTLTASFDRVLAGRQPIFEEGRYRTARDEYQSVSRLLLPLGPDARTGAMVLLCRLVYPDCCRPPDGNCLQGAYGTLDRMSEIDSLEGLERRAGEWLQRGTPRSLSRNVRTVRIANLWGRGAVPYAIEV